MKLILLSILALCMSVSAIAQHSNYVLKQRAIMLSQLQFEKNLDILRLDPKTCLTPLDKDERLRILRANTQQLERTGKLFHCQDLKIKGRRKIMENLRRQKPAVIQMLGFNVPDEVGLSDSTAPVMATSTPPILASEIPDGQDNTEIQPREVNLPNIGSSPSALPVLSGYVGVPYLSNPYSDETFALNLNEGNLQAKYYQSAQLPDGLTFANYRYGIISGIPRRAGQFSPIIETGKIGFYGAKYTVYRGPVSFRIFNKPKHTILNPGQRRIWTGLSFHQKGAPFLGLTFKENDYVRALNGLTRGKYYYEIKVNRIGGNFSVGLSSINADQSHQNKSNFFINQTSSANPHSFSVQLNYGGNETRTLKDGGVIMVAVDMDNRKFWYGINGLWHARPGLGYCPLFPSDCFDPVFDLGKHNPELRTAPVIWPEFHGGSGTSITLNFGDQPWHFDPPKGFSGVPLETNFIFPNMWNSNTASRFADSEDVLGAFFETNSNWWSVNMPLSVHSTQSYVYDEKGDAILAMNPKSSGRWQFELSGKGFPFDYQMGLAPADFDTGSYKKVGSAGTFSIGVRGLDEQVSRTGKGLIEVDGQKHYIDAFDDKTRITFDCDFDRKTVAIYANGKLILNTKLPANKHGQWAIASSNSSTATYLYSLLGNSPAAIKYPVSGAKPWAFDTQTSGGGEVNPENNIVSEIKTCKATSFNYDGNEVPASDPLSCELRESRIGGSTTCITPKTPRSCMDLQNGKFYCSYTDTFVTQSSKAECEKNCFAVNGITKTCTENGWK